GGGGAGASVLTASGGGGGGAGCSAVPSGWSDQHFSSAGGAEIDYRVLSFDATAPGQGLVGHTYSYQYTVVGGAPGVTATTFTVTAGSLPPGLSLSSEGVLSGTTTTAGNYTFTVTATNSGATTTRQDT